MMKKKLTRPVIGRLLHFSTTNKIQLKCWELLDIRLRSFGDEKTSVRLCIHPLHDCLCPTNEAPSLMDIVLSTSGFDLLSSVRPKDFRDRFWTATHVIQNMVSHTLQVHYTVFNYRNL